MVEEDDLVKIWTEGQIPLLQLSSDPATNDDVELVLQAASQADPTPYTAVSHVWADGLGNSRSNALPRCQLR